MNKMYSVILFIMVTFQGLAAQTKIILKFDDIAVKSHNCSAKEVLDLLLSRKIKASFGFIADRSDATAKNFMASYLNATNSNGENLFEIWHHGLNHVNPEFKGTTYEYQKQHFESADALINTNVGVQMHSFGAPFNATDNITYQVVSENANYKVMLLGSTPPTSSGILNLNQRVNLESSTANPSYATFLNNYNSKKNTYKDYMVIQAHPNGWNATKINELTQTIDFLISEGCEFVTPYEYYLSLQPLGTEFIENANKQVEIIVNNGTINLENNSHKVPLNLTIFNMLGQKLFDKKNILSGCVIPIPSIWSNQIMVFKVEQDNIVANRKICIPNSQ